MIPNWVPLCKGFIRSRPQGLKPKNYHEAFDARLKPCSSTAIPNIVVAAIRSRPDTKLIPDTTLLMKQVLVNDAHCTASQQLFHSVHKGTVRKNIISVALHDHHEIAGALHVEQYLGFATLFDAERVECVYGSRAGALQCDADAQ